MPLFAKSSGADAGAGMVTGALLLTTVAVELVTRGSWPGADTGGR